LGKRYTTGGQLLPATNIYCEGSETLIGLPMETLVERTEIMGYNWRARHY